MSKTSAKQEARLPGTGSPTRVALLADYREEKWPSMDLVADMLAMHLQRPTTEAAAEPSALDFEVQLLNPPMRRRFSQLPGTRMDRLRVPAWMLDRLMNRFYDYPRFLRTSGTGNYHLFHVVDHSYSQLVHALPRGRTVVTCHDLDTFRCLWESEDGRRGSLFRTMARRILSGMQKAAHVCCDSKATRDELLARCLLPPERTSVVPLGLRPEFLMPSDATAEARIDALLKGGAPCADILHVGSTISRKRIDGLLAVFARVRREVEPRARLIRVGGPFTSAQLQLARNLGLEDESLLVMPFLSPSELATVYRRAALVLLPSAAEGFGFPVIESLASGTPVIASDLTVLREVGGEAAQYAPATDIAAWTLLVKELLIERHHAPDAWEARRQRCLQQGRQFLWNETARRYKQVYGLVLADNELDEHDKI